MTGFTPELVERVAAVIDEIALAPPCFDVEKAAIAALEASGIAELTLALRRLREHPQSPAAQEWADDLLAKIGGNHG